MFIEFDFYKLFQMLCKCQGAVNRNKEMLIRKMKIDLCLKYPLFKLYFPLIRKIATFHWKEEKESGRESERRITLQKNPALRVIYI